jgi:hypothetical protein
MILHSYIKKNMPQRKRSARSKTSRLVRTPGTIGTRVSQKVPFTLLLTTSGAGIYASSLDLRVNLVASSQWGSYLEIFMWCRPRQIRWKFASSIAGTAPATGAGYAMAIGPSVTANVPGSTDDVMLVPSSKFFSAATPLVSGSFPLSLGVGMNDWITTPSVNNGYSIGSMHIYCAPGAGFATVPLGYFHGEFVIDFAMGK